MESPFLGTTIYHALQFSLVRCAIAPHSNQHDNKHTAIMPSLGSLVLSLALSTFLVTPALTATIDQCNSRKVLGSITGAYGGDSLRDTRCECIKNDDEAENFIPVGHIYQVGSSQNIPIVPPFTRRSASRQDTDQQYVDKAEYYNYHSNATFVICTKESFGDDCVTVPRDNDPKKDDQFCYSNTVFFNGQRRMMYNQKFRETYDNDCKALCKEFMNDEDVEGAGPRVVYDRIDDMCDDCE